jgi:hypothetical protein
VQDPAVDTEKDDADSVSERLDKVEINEQSIVEVVRMEVRGRRRREEDLRPRRVMIMRMCMGLRVIGPGVGCEHVQEFMIGMGFCTVLVLVPQQAKARYRLGEKEDPE